MSSSAPLHHRASVESFYHKTKRHEARTDRRLEPFWYSHAIHGSSTMKAYFLNNLKTDSVMTKNDDEGNMQWYVAVHS